jgi:hypothetical protein
LEVSSLGMCSVLSHSAHDVEDFLESLGSGREACLELFVNVIVLRDTLLWNVSGRTWGREMVCAEEEKIWKFQHCKCDSIIHSQVRHDAARIDHFPCELDQASDDPIPAHSTRSDRQVGRFVSCPGLQSASLDSQCSDFSLPGRHMSSWDRNW